MNSIHVSAVVMRDAQDRILHVRKSGTSTFMLPGGKPVVGESPSETAVREFEEELGVALTPNKLVFLGEFRAPAANESGFDVVAQVFSHPIVHAIAARAEIDAIEWVDPARPVVAIAPLCTIGVFPALGLTATAGVNDGRQRSR